MNRIVILYGLLAGLIVSAVLAFGTTSMMHKGTDDSIMFAVGMGASLLAFSLIIPAVRRYRASLPGQKIRFGKAFKVGFWVAFIGSACYALTWSIIYKFYYPNFLDDMYNRQVEKMRQAGKSAAEILNKKQEVADMKVWYDTWPGLIGMTMMEILPLGVLVALICAWVFSRKQKLKIE